MPNATKKPTLPSVAAMPTATKKPAILPETATKARELFSMHGEAVRKLDTLFVTWLLGDEVTPPPNARDRGKMWNFYHDLKALLQQLQTDTCDKQ